MKEIYAETRVSRRNAVMARRDDGRLRIEVIGDLARSLAKQLLEEMEIREDVDPETGDLVVRAGVYVAEPGERVSGSYGSYGRSPVAFEVPRYNPALRADMNFEGYINMLPGGEIRVTQEPMVGAKLPPATLTQEKLNEAIDSMKRAAQADLAKTFMPTLLMNPLSFLDTRMERKKAQQDGEVAALLKARGEKQVRENTKKRGPALTIEVGVRKITMPEEKKEPG